MFALLLALSALASDCLPIATEGPDLVTRACIATNPAFYERVQVGTTNHSGATVTSVVTEIEITHRITSDPVSTRVGSFDGIIGPWETSTNVSTRVDRQHNAVDGDTIDIAAFDDNDDEVWALVLEHDGSEWAVQ